MKNLAKLFYAPDSEDRGRCFPQYLTGNLNEKHPNASSSLKAHDFFSYTLENGLSLHAIDARKNNFPERKTVNCFELMEDSLQLTFDLKKEWLNNDQISSDSNQLIKLYYFREGSKLPYLESNTPYLIFVIGLPWLNNNHVEAAKYITREKTAQHNSSHYSTIFENLYKKEFMQASEIAHSLISRKNTLLYIRRLSFELLESFFKRILLKNNTTILPASSYCKMTIIAKKIDSYLDTEMPSLDEISREFHVSKSTLKRHFKLVHSKNIYTYYIENKIAYGKQLLEERDKNINEIAYLLGYQKASSFSKAFKKVYGLLPSELLKTRS